MRKKPVGYAGRYHLSGYRNGRLVSQPYCLLRDLKAAYRNNSINATELLALDFSGGKVTVVNITPVARKPKKA